MRYVVRRAAVWAAVLGVCAIGAGPAQAARDPFGATIGAVNPQAGAHSDIRITLALGTGHVDRLMLHLPAGLLGDPAATPTCAPAVWASDGICPASTQIGSVVSVLALGDATEPPDPTDPTQALTIPGRIFNIAPAGGEPARLGIFIRPTLGIGPDIKLESPIVVRPGDLGLDSTVTVPPKIRTWVDPGDHSQGTTDSLIDLFSMRMTLYGPRTSPPSPARPLAKPFMVNPTSCAPHTFAVDATYYDDPRTDSTTAPFQVTGCDRVPFTPTLTTDPGTVTGGQPSAFTVGIGLPAPTGADDEIVQSQARRVQVTLPEGVVLSPGVAADGLAACSDAAFGFGRGDVDPACPAASRLGAVTVDSPLIGQLTGDVFLGEQRPDRTFRLLAWAGKGDVRLRLEGVATPDPATGRLVATFDDLPEQPFTAFTLAFRGGDTAVLSMPSTCGATQSTGVFTPVDGAGDVTASAPLNVTDCSAPAFAPTLGAAYAPLTPAADSRLSLTIDRGDGQPRLRDMSFTLPAGQLGHLFAFPPCAIADARAGACSAASRVGTATVATGTGGRPLALSGGIYLVAPYDGGVGGLAVVVPVKVGPLDLGTVVSITRLSLRAGDLAIQAQTEPLPTIVAGIPLAIRSLRLDLDRDGFLLNGTSCAPSTAAASFTGLGGETAASSVPVALTGCAGLPFAPTMYATFDGPRAKPGLTINVASRNGDANLRQVQLTFPPSVGVSLTATRNACTPQQAAADACPDSSIVGSATARSPLLPAPLTGPVRLQLVPGGGLPKLVMDLDGFIHLPLGVKIAFAGGRLQSTVDGIPDVPLSAFTLQLRPGLLQSSETDALCTERPVFDTTLVAQSGATRTAQLPAAVPCVVVAPGARSLRLGSAPHLALQANGHRLTSMRLTLPRTLRLNAKALRRGALGQIDGGRRARVTRAGRTVTFWTVRKGVSAIRLQLGRGALRPGPGLGRARSISIPVRFGDALGHHRSMTIRVPAKP